MNGTGAFDDYLLGLLTPSQADAGAADADSFAPPAGAAQAEAPTARAAVPGGIAAALIAEMEADPAFAAAAPAVDPAAADVVAEMEADPAFAAPARADDVPDPARIAADLIAEMEADPAFAAPPPAASAPDPGRIAADLIAEMEADPAFAAAARPAAAAATPKAAPKAAPRPATRLPAHLQALFQPSPPGDESLRRRAADRSTRWLRLRCAGQAYALELLKVQEVVRPAPVLKLRGAAPAILGIMNLRGQVVPVLDLGLHLGAAAADVDAHTRVVVLEENGETMGLRVSSVEDVINLTDQQIEPPDDARLCRISNHLFRGVARIGAQPMILLDASGLLH